MDMQYILDENRNPVKTPDLHEWGKWMEESEKRRVERTTINNIKISTVFLGLDHSRSKKGPPILFETMAFDKTREVGTEVSGYTSQYATWDDAVAGHWRTVKAVKRRAYWRTVKAAIAAEREKIDG